MIDDDYGDISEELRAFGEIVNDIKGKVTVTLLSGDMFVEAADEIDYLRQMCDELAHALTCTESFCTLDEAGLNNWRDYIKELSANADTAAGETDVRE